MHLQSCYLFLFYIFLDRVCETEWNAIQSAQQRNVLYVQHSERGRKSVKLLDILMKKFEAASVASQPLRLAGGKSKSKNCDVKETSDIVQPSVKKRKAVAVNLKSVSLSVPKGQKSEHAKAEQAANAETSQRALISPAHSVETSVGVGASGRGVSLQEADPANMATSKIGKKCDDRTKSELMPKRTNKVSTEQSMHKHGREASKTNKSKREKIDSLLLEERTNGIVTRKAKPRKGRRADDKPAAVSAAPAAVSAAPAAVSAAPAAAIGLPDGVRVSLPRLPTGAPRRFRPPVDPDELPPPPPVPPPPLLAAMEPRHPAPTEAPSGKRPAPVAEAAAGGSRKRKRGGDVAEDVRRRVLAEYRRSQVRVRGRGCRGDARQCWRACR